MKHHYVSLVLLGMSMLALLGGWVMPAYPGAIPAAGSLELAVPASSSCFASAAVNGMQVRDEVEPSDTALRRFARFDGDAATAALHVIVQEQQQQPRSALPAGLRQVVLCNVGVQNDKPAEHLAI